MYVYICYQKDRQYALPVSTESANGFLVAHVFEHVMYTYTITWWRCGIVIITTAQLLSAKPTQVQILHAACGDS